jgi:putative oxidoreductase
MLGRFFEDLPKPHVHLGSFLLRLGLAGIFIFHGYLKLSQLNNPNSLGWSDELPVGTQMAVAWGELACGIALLVGFLSRLAALGMIIVQVGAITLERGRFDFIHIEYNKGDPARVPTGYEYNLALIIMCLAVLAIGSGKVSLDYLLFGRRRPHAFMPPAHNPKSASAQAPAV